MHMHSIAGLVLHATGFAVLGFFVLFAAGKAEGIVRAVGTVLGWWLWLLAVLVVVLGVMHPMGDKDGPWADRMHGWMHDGAKPDAAAPPAAPAPATPAPAPAPAPKKP